MAAATVLVADTCLGLGEIRALEDYLVAPHQAAERDQTRNTGQYDALRPWLGSGASETQHHIMQTSSCASHHQAHECGTLGGGALRDIPHVFFALRALQLRTLNDAQKPMSAVRYTTLVEPF